MKITNRSLVITKYLLLIATLGYVIYLYADVFLFPSVNDGYSLFALILFVPYPLILSLVINRYIGGREYVGEKQLMVFNLFPVLCFVLTVGQFLLLSFNNLMYLICVLISILLFCLSIVLFTYELKNCSGNPNS